MANAKPSLISRPPDRQGAIITAREAEIRKYNGELKARVVWAPATDNADA